MNSDQILVTIFLVLIIYGWGVLNRGWRGPGYIGGYIKGYILEKWREHRQFREQNRRSDDEDADPEDTEGTVYLPVDLGPLRSPQKLNAPPIGPRKLTHLSDGTPFVYEPPKDKKDGNNNVSNVTKLKFNPDSKNKQAGESNLAWTRRMIELGIFSPTEIDEIGAKKFGVHPGSVKRWRRELKLGFDDKEDKK